MIPLTQHLRIDHPRNRTKPFINVNRSYSKVEKLIMSLLLRKQVTWNFSFINWENPRWITTFWYFSNLFYKDLNEFNAFPISMVIVTCGMLTKAARNCGYSTYCWFVENSVTFDTMRGKYFSVVFTACLVELRLSRIWINYPIVVGTAWLCEFHFLKQSQMKKRELNFAGA